MAVRTIVVALVLSACASAASAQNQGATNGLLHHALGLSDDWTLLGSFRVRGEGIDGQFRPALNDHDAAMQLQTTLFVQYKSGGFRIGGEGIDSREYFERKVSSTSTTEVDAVELLQGYVGYDFAAPSSGTSAAFTLGRQTLNDGSRRLIARNVYRNTINSFTGAKFEYKDKAGDLLRLFWFLPINRLPSDLASLEDNEVERDRETTALQFYGGSYTVAKAFGGTFEMYGYKLEEDDTQRFATRDRHILTTGVRLFRAPKADTFDWDVEGDYQFGHARATTSARDVRDLDVSAYFLHAELGHTFKGGWKPRVAVKYDLASGDGRNPNTYTRFDTLFGARRFDYGPTSLYGAIQRANLNSPSVQLDVAPSKRADAFVAWRPAWLENRTDSFAATSVRDATGRSGKFAGNQFEGRVRYWLVPKILRADVGAAYLLKGHFLNDAPNAPHDGDTKYGYAALEFGF